MTTTRPFVSMLTLSTLALAILSPPAQAVFLCARKKLTTGNIAEGADIKLRTACKDGEVPLQIEVGDGAGASVYASATTDRALVGVSQQNAGVEGDSNSGNGVTGVSQSRIGVEGRSESNIAIYGSSGTGRGIVGVAGSQTGVEGDSTSGTGVFGSSVTGAAMWAAGPAIQDRNQGGWVKALVHVNPFPGTHIDRCYNGLTADSVPPCGFSVTQPNLGSFNVQVPFQVNDRFILAQGDNTGSTWPDPSYGTAVAGSPYFQSSSTVVVNIYYTNYGDAAYTADPFTLVVF